jgi:hypothetical protein
MLGNEHPVMQHNIPEELSSLVSIVFVIVRKNMKNLSQDLYVDSTGAVFFQ